LELRVDLNSTCEDIKEKALEKMQVINQKIDKWQQMKKTLKYFSGFCGNTTSPFGKCTIPEAFYEDDNLGNK